MKRRIQSLFFCLVLVCMLPVSQSRGFASGSLSKEQNQSIAMLNYLMVLTSEINASSESRVFLEEAYSSLLNNLDPSKVDSTTQGYLEELLDTMEGYRMISIKRDRIRYRYEQKKARAMREAVSGFFRSASEAPFTDLLKKEDAGGSFGSISEAPFMNPLQKLVLTFLKYAAESAWGYYDAAQDLSLEETEEEWSLDDEESRTLHESRKKAFSYMLDIVQEYGLPGRLALSEKHVEDFVECKKDTNTDHQLLFLENNRGVYEAYGEYWLLRAECFYRNGEYEKCLEMYRQYGLTETRIFRKDKALARILPLVCVSIDQVSSFDDEYRDTVLPVLSQLKENTDIEDWDLRFFAACVYHDLYRRAGKEEDLQEAYWILLDNINNLVPSQRVRNKQYVNALKRQEGGKGLTKAQAAELSRQNQILENERKTELPPVYEPLFLQCRFLFSLLPELSLSSSELQKIDRILHEDGEPLFLSEPVDRLFRMEEAEEMEVKEVWLGRDGLELPARCVTDDCRIRVSLPQRHIIIDDWGISEVVRQEEGKLPSFFAMYSSPTFQEICDDISDEERLLVQILPKEGTDCGILEGTFYAEPSSGFLSFLEGTRFSPEAPVALMETEDPGKFPFSAIARMHVHHTCGCACTCSGFLVDRDLLLTSCHPLVCETHHALADKCTLYFGWKSGTDYLVCHEQTVDAENLFPGAPLERTSEGYRLPETSSGERSQQDYAFLRLSEEVGTQTGWFGLEEEDTNWHEYMVYTLAGYGDDGFFSVHATTGLSNDMQIDSLAGDREGGSPVFADNGKVIGIDQGDGNAFQITDMILCMKPLLPVS